MIIPEKINKKFEQYHKWFFTFLATEFLNLPIKGQEKFLIIAKKFIDNCEKVHKEAQNIKEHTFTIYVEKIRLFDKKCIIIGKILEIDKKIKINIPVVDIPKIGENIECILFSIDEKSWYSSKEALIIGR